MYTCLLLLDLSHARLSVNTHLLILLSCVFPDLDVDPFDMSTLLIRKATIYCSLGRQEDSVACGELSFIHPTSVGCDIAAHLFHLLCSFCRPGPGGDVTGPVPPGVRALYAFQLHRGPGVHPASQSAGALQRPHRKHVAGHHASFEESKRQARCSHH